MSEQDEKIVNLGRLKKFKEYYDTDITTPINNKIDSKTNAQSGEIITTNNDTIGYFKNIKINGNTRYKKSDGTYTDTWEDGVSLESLGEKEKNADGKYPIEVVSIDNAKNLIKSDNILDGYYYDNNNTLQPNSSFQTLKKAISVQSNKTYYVVNSSNTKTNVTYVLYYATDGSVIKCEYDKNIITIPSNCTSIRFSTGGLKNLCFSLSENYSVYTFDKRTILLDSPLRKVGEVADILDLDNSQITRKCKTITIDGSSDENWAIDLAKTDIILFYCKNIITENAPKNYNIHLISDKFSSFRYDNMWDNTNEGISVSNNILRINISKSKLETQDGEGLKKWLQSNPVTVVYQLATPITEDIEVSSNTLTDFATSCTLTIGNTIKGNIECNEVVGLIPSVEENGTRLTNVETDNTTNKSNITNLQKSLENKAEKNHNHRIADVTGLQDKLDEVFQSVSNGKTLLETAITDKGSSVSKAGDVATFEELKTGIVGIGTGVCELNIFTQTEEPSTKEGIWLKTSNTYDDVLNIGNKGYTQMTDIPYYYYYGSAVAINNDIYLVGCGYESAYNYRYNTTTNNYTKMTYIPYSFSHGSAVSVGNDIYLLGGGNKNNYKYNTLTNTYTKMADMPYATSDKSAVAIGNDIYLLSCGDGSKYNYKYDTATDTYTKLTDIPYEFYHGSAVAIGNNIYLLGGEGGKRYNYKYDTLTNTYTKLKDIPYDFYGGSAVSVGNDIYILGGGRYGSTNFSWYNYKYDTTTDTYMRMTDIPYYYYNGSAVAIGNDIYLLGSSSSDYQQYNYKYNNTIYKNSILFLYDNIPFKYKAKIFNTSYERLNYINFNSVIMTDENGNNINVEVYIGNGNHWDKI